MADPNDQEPRIFVDTDWKEEARKEKERLDRETRDMPKRDEIPPPSMVELIQMLVMQISIGLAGMQDPQTGQALPPSLPLAKHYIDLLELLQQKTKGNLDPDEQRVLEGTLHEVRMAFVQVAGGGGTPPPGAAPGAGK